MPGESDLTTLLATMAPVLHEGEFVFCTVAAPVPEALRTRAVAVVREQEGITLVLDRAMELLRDLVDEAT